MAVTYKKLWKLLDERHMSAAELRKISGIAPNTMTKLRRDEPVMWSLWSLTPKRSRIVDDNVCTIADLRKKNGGLPILRASVSAKWTMRSDRAQNSRAEALNLIRNRKRNLPHIVVTGEPMPARIASLALGTGDIDCVYHFALHELIGTVKNRR